MSVNEPFVHSNVQRLFVMQFRLKCQLSQAEEAAETAALADEADMPLEQLLARYGLVMGNGNAASDHEGEDGMEVDGDTAAEAPSKSTEAPAEPVKVEDSAQPHDTDTLETGELKST